MITSKLTSKSQTTVPKSVRKALNLSPGDLLTYEISGDRVILTGWGVGEKYWGGYSQRQRVQSKWLVPMPEGMDSRMAMAIGTAGFTAMLCVMALEEAGVKVYSGFEGTVIDAVRAWVDGDLEPLQAPDGIARR